MSKAKGQTGPGGLPYRAGAGVVLVNAGGLVFAGRRIDSPTDRPAAWQMPQGGIDRGETPRQAALRELTEETGVSADLVTVEAETADWVTYDLPPELLGKVWKGKYCGQKQKWFLLRFHGTDADVRIDTEHPEFSEWCWMPAFDLAEGIVPFKRAIYDQVLGEFADRLKAG
ncbi:MAG: RNA pyrophosphohydrolase [Paracoccus sp. (in: a-proteobacteria)]